tara:strand:+ start:994 stop:1587 length:594 start_codon:yes stop_codon:yes gene_type:complete
MRIKLVNILIRKIKIFWDNLYGLDFHTTIKTNNFNLDPDKFYDCSPSASFAIKKLFSSIGFTNKDSFLDIGCGKGSVLRLLLKYPLDKIEGIEISESIYNICSKNLKILNDKRLKATCIDARFFENYDKFNFLYAYNPCNEMIFEEIIKKIVTDSKNSKKFIYINSKWDNILKKYGFKFENKYIDEWGNDIKIFSLD